MRLAHPRLDNDILLLSFQFPFQQKRAQDSKSTALIAQIVSNHLNLRVSVETKIDASLSTKPPITLKPATPPDPAHASLISQVQDIMGGGEIVDAEFN
jgi:hypothetical protein